MQITPFHRLMGWFFALLFSGNLLVVLSDGRLTDIPILCALNLGTILVVGFWTLTWVWAYASLSHFVRDFVLALASMLILVTISLISTTDGTPTQLGWLCAVIGGMLGVGYYYDVRKKAATELRFSYWTGMLLFVMGSVVAFLGVWYMSIMSLLGFYMLGSSFWTVLVGWMLILDAALIGALAVTVHIRSK